MNKQTPDVGTVVGRIKWLMDKLWGGSQTKTAAYLGVSQGWLANVLAGRRKPGRTLLLTLAAHPLINDQWLRDGTGPPLMPEATTPVGEAALPIACKPFVGVPDENPDCLAEELYPISRRLYKRSRYWIHLYEPHHPFVGDSDLALRMGDWLLMEPDSANWPENLKGKPCLVEIRLPDLPLLLCRAEVSSPIKRTTHDFDFLGQLPEGIQDHKSLYHGDRLLKGIDVDGLTSNQSPRPNRLPVKVIAVAIHRCGDL